MAAPRVARSPTCLNCLRQLARPSPPTTTTTVTISLTQTRARTTKAELEDLQGIAVRLLRDIPSFGRKHAIIRVKPGRMRNFWFPKAAAEYMTRKRFAELGLTEAAIGVRDRTFGSKVPVDEKETSAAEDAALEIEEKPADRQAKPKVVLTLAPEETQSLLEKFLPQTLIFKRKPIAAPAPAPVPEPVPAPAPAPAVPRSPSLATHAATSVGTPPPPPTPASTPAAPAAAAAAESDRAIFGSVSATDVLARVKEHLLEGDLQKGSRAAVEVEGVEIVGLDEGDDRIKRLGTFAVLVSPGKGLKPVKRVVSVVSDE